MPIVYRLSKKSLTKIHKEAESMAPDQIINKMLELTDPDMINGGRTSEAFRRLELKERLSVYEYGKILKEKLAALDHGH